MNHRFLKRLVLSIFALFMIFSSVLPFNSAYAEEDYIVDGKRKFYKTHQDSYEPYEYYRMDWEIMNDYKRILKNSTIQNSDIKVQELVVSKSPKKTSEIHEFITEFKPTSIESSMSYDYPRHTHDNQNWFGPYNNVKWTKVYDMSILEQPDTVITYGRAFEVNGRYYDLVYSFEEIHWRFYEGYRGDKWAVGYTRYADRTKYGDNDPKYDPEPPYRSLSFMTPSNAGLDSFDGVNFEGTDWIPAVEYQAIPVIPSKKYPVSGYEGLYNNTPAIYNPPVTVRIEILDSETGQHAQLSNVAFAVSDLDHCIDGFKYEGTDLTNVFVSDKYGKGLSAVKSSDGYYFGAKYIKDVMEATTDYKDSLTIESPGAVFLQSPSINSGDFRITSFLNPGAENGNTHIELSGIVFVGSSAEVVYICDKDDHDLSEYNSGRYIGEINNKIEYDNTETLNKLLRQGYTLVSDGYQNNKNYTDKHAVYEIHLTHEGEIVEPKGSVVVEHRDEETLELLKPSEEVASDEPIGTPYATSEEIFTDYTFSKMDPESAPASGSVTEEIQTVVYLYKKARGTVKVEHRDYDTNELLTDVETVKDNERVGEPYQTSQKEFENYYFVKHDENSAPESGVVKSHLQTVVYYYGQEEEIPVIEETGSVEVKYIDEETNELIIPREIVKNNAPVGEEYITEEKVFPNYLFTKMAETSDEPNGLVEVGHKVVIYMYRPVYSEDYTFLSGTPDKELPPEVLGLLPTRAYKYFNESSVDADIVPTREVEVPGGKWVFKDWNDPTLIINREDVHFVGIWVFEAAPLPPTPKGRVSVVYKTVDGKILKPEEIVLEDEIGEPYSTEELTFEGYTFVETTGDDPLGHLEERDKLVIYLYEKDKEPTPPEPEPEPTGTVCVVYKDSEGNILEKENCFLVDVPVDTPYDTEKKTFSEYNFKTIEGEPSGKVIEGTIKITYIYSKIKKGTVEVIYIDDSGKTLKGPDIVLKDVEVGKDYSTSKLSFNGYDFLKVDEKSAPVSGKVKEGTQRVIYVYKKTPVVTNAPVNTGAGDAVMFTSLALFASSILLVILKKQKQKIGS